MPKLNLQPVGYSDRPPWAAGDRYSEMQNMIVRNGYAQRVRGDAIGLPAADSLVQHLINAFSFGANWWIIAAESKVVAWDQASPSDNINPTDYGVLAGKGELTSGVLNGYPILNNVNRAEPWEWNLVKGAAMTAISGAPNVAAMRVGFGNVMVGLDTSADAGTDWDNTEETVVWSGATDGLPSTAPWTPANDNIAGSVRLGATTGPVVDFTMVRQNVGIVAKTDALYAMTFTGGPLAFSFTRLFGTGGVLTRNCMTTAFEGVVYGMGPYGFFATDGSTVRDISDDRVRDEYIDNLAEDAAGSFTCLNPLGREVWFCPVTGPDWPDECYVYDIDSGEFGKRGFPSISFAAHGVNTLAVDDSFDGGNDDSFDDGPDIPFNFRTASPQTSLVHWCQPEEPATYFADLNADDRQGRVVREGIQPDGDGVYTVRRVWLDGEIPPSGVTITLRARYNDTDSYNGGGSVEYPQSGRWAAIMAKGRQFQVEVAAGGSVPWSIQRIGLEIAETGARF